MKKLSHKTARRLYTIAIVVLSVIFLGSLGILGWYLWQSNHSQNTYSDLQGLVQANTPSTVPATSSSDPVEDSSQVTSDPTLETTESTSPWVTVIDPDTGEEIQILPEYAPIYELNSDLVGWLTIEGTNVDYPVMQTPDSPNYYLRRDFYGNYSVAGCLYAKEEADVFAPSDNITIYGHRMSDGTMFAQLFEYRNEEFYLQYPYIQFNTLTERHTYQVAYVFITTVSEGYGFHYHNFVNASSEYAFINFTDECSWNQIYDTGVEVSYGDKLITLSTCEYSQVNGRFVIVAKRIS